MSTRQHLRAVPELQPIGPMVTDDELEAEQLQQRVGEFLATRGAVRLEFGMATGDGQRLWFDVESSTAPTLRVLAIAVFPGHEVIGQSHATDRDDFLVFEGARGAAWRHLACTDLIEQLSGVAVAERLVT